MMFHFFRRDSSEQSIAALYGTIVAQARAAPFYRNCAVPDTVNGRFEMVVLHLVLVLHRLESTSPGRRFGQALFDWFCRDMDGSLREMGVGDLAVPAKMRKIGEAFYGRRAVYVEALAGTDSASLPAALERNVLGAEAGAGGAIPLAVYVRATADGLAAQAVEAICRAEISFPDPSAIAGKAQD